MARTGAWRVPAGRTPEEYRAKDAEGFLAAAAEAGVATPLLAAAVAAGARGAGTGTAGRSGSRAPISSGATVITLEPSGQAARTGLPRPALPVTPAVPNGRS